jgi:hypothetical protein
MPQKASAWKILVGIVIVPPLSIFPFGCFLFNERDLLDVFNERDRFGDSFVSVILKLKSKTLPVVVVVSLLFGICSWRFSSVDWDDNEPSSQFKLIRSYSSSTFPISCCSAATWYWVIDGRIDDELTESHVTTIFDGLSRTACSSLN